MTVKTDRLVTLFGGGGFVGRYVAQALFKAGARVRIAEREPKRAYFLKPLCGLGQIQFVRADIADPGQVAAAVAGRRRGGEPGRHPQGQFPARSMSTARATSPRPPRRPGVPALVHVSAIGADPDAASAYGRSKGEGEAAVRAAFPGATIVRPSIAFGLEDDFVNRFARMAQLLPVPPGDPRRAGRCSRSMPPISARRSRSPRSIRAAMPGRPTSSAGRRC